MQSPTIRWLLFYAIVRMNENEQSIYEENQHEKRSKENRFRGGYGSRASIDHGTKFRFGSSGTRSVTCWGVPSPNPAFYAASSGKEVRLTKKNYNTPHRTHVIKTRLDDEEWKDFNERLSVHRMNQAEFLRKAIKGAVIRPIIKVSAVSDSLLEAVGKMTSEYNRIGNNLNQIARHLNEFRTPYPQLAEELRTAVSDLNTLKFEVLEKVGNAIGHDQTYQL